MNKGAAMTTRGGAGIFAARNWNVAANRGERNLLKKYRSTSELLAEINSLLTSSKASPDHSPLDDVIEALCRGRHYTWAGIYLAVENDPARQLLGSGSDLHPGTALPETRTKVVVSIKLAGRELGVLDVESDQENAFGAEDRVLLEKVAHALALFLVGPGKYITRKARQAALAR